MIVASGENAAARVVSALNELGRASIQSLLLEGGPHLARARSSRPARSTGSRSSSRPSCSAASTPRAPSRAPASSASPTASAPLAVERRAIGEDLLITRPAAGVVAVFTGLGRRTSATVAAVDAASRRRPRCGSRPRWRRELALGDSVAVNGVCLTATEAADGRLQADGDERDARAHRARRARGRRPRQPRAAAAAGDRLDGHIVQGHVDGVGERRCSDRGRLLARPARRLPGRSRCATSSRRARSRSTA